MSRKYKHEGLETLAICIILCLLGGGLIAGMKHWLDEREQARETERANQVVAEKVEAARACLASQEWDRGMELLQDALATEHATERGEAETLLEQMRLAKGDALLEAERSRQEEQCRRREARVRAAPLFLELRTFVKQARAQLHESTFEEKDLVALVIQELQVTDPKERAMLRREANRLPEVKALLKQNIARVRTTIKERFQSDDPEDRAAFEKAVDQELDALVEEIQRV